MTNRNRLPVYVLILLLTFFSNNGSALFCKVSNELNTYYSAFHKVTDQKAIILSKKTAFKTWIKIRYKGGERTNFSFTSSTHIIHAIFVDFIKEQSYATFIPVQHVCIFKLRGPPVIIS